MWWLFQVPDVGTMEIASIAAQGEPLPLFSTAENHGCKPSPWYVTSLRAVISPSLCRWVPGSTWVLQLLGTVCIPKRRILHCVSSSHASREVCV